MHERGCRNYRDDQGQTVVMSVLFFTVLFGFAALVIDGGTFLLTRRNLQGDADAAVMAAAQELPASTGAATISATDYAENRNDSGATLSSIVFSQGNRRARVELRRSTPGFFGGFFGMSAPTIRARAAAQVDQVGQLNGVLPFAALKDSFTTVGQPPPQIAIKVAAGNAQVGNFGAVAPNHSPPLCDGTPTGASGHRDEIISSFRSGGVMSCGPEVGDVIQKKTGNMVNMTAEGFNQRFGSTDGSHPDRFDDVLHWDAALGRYIVDKPNSPRIGFIPVVTNMAGVGEWSPGASDGMRVYDYVMVYLGDLTRADQPAYTRGPGAQIQVFATPISGRMPANAVDFEVRDSWDPNSMSPLVIRMVE